MPKYIKDLESGYIQRLQYVDNGDMQIGVQRPGDGQYDEWLSLLNMQQEQGVVIPPPASTQTAPFTFDPTGLPEGAKVIVRVESGDHFLLTGTDLSEPIELVDPGTYRFIVDAPWPAFGFSIDMELT